MRRLKKMTALCLAVCICLSGCGKVGGSDKKDATSSPMSSEELSEKAERENALNPTTPEPTEGTFTATQAYSNEKYEVKVMGLKEYKKIKTDKFTDKAKAGKKFLVLFLEVRNRTQSKVYFHADYLSAKLDGKEITHTVLFNEPEDYPTMFANIAADSYYGGFIVWEVPTDWNKIEITYEGFKGSDGLTLDSTLTKDDLKKPETYSPMKYGMEN